MWPLVGAVARVAGPMLARGAMRAAPSLGRAATAAMKSPMGKGAAIGYAVGRGQSFNQGRSSSMDGWFPGSTDGDGTMY